MTRWVVALVSAVVALVLGVPITVMLITAQPACGAVGSFGTVGRQSASGGFTAENVTIAKAAAVEAGARRLPPRALVVILATGFQESGIRNLSHGDRDSVGWLQQRAGWGSVAERMNPQVAAGKFYDHLVRVPGWEALPVTVAAQRVQISAFPDAYARWQSKAEQLAAIVSAGTGSAAAAPAAPATTTTTAKAAIVALAKQHGVQATPHTDPQGQPAFDLMSSGGLNTTIAEELRTHHAAYGARYVISQMQIASPRGNWAWRPYSPITSSGDFQHTRHVHISYTDGPVTAQGAATPQTACTGIPAVRVVTWNAYYGDRHPGSSGPLGNARIYFAMAALGKQADIIGGQEFSEASHKDAALSGLGDEWTATALDTSHPIFYRRTFTLLSSTSELVFERSTDMEGPDQGTRYVNTAVLRNAAGQTVTEVNFHEIPTIQKHGKLNVDQPKRIAVARHIYQVAMASAQAHSAQGGVLVTCDCNYDGDMDGMAAAAGLTRAATVFGNPEQATRKRNIDQIMWRGGVPVSEKVLPAFGSDHSPRLVTFLGSSGSAGGGPVPASFDQQGNPRTVEQAAAWMQANMPNGAPGEPVLNACERYMNLAYGVGGGYPTALSHWNAAGPKSAGYSSPPRGALVFWRTGNPAGHVALSLGNGIVVSTDYDASTHRYRAGRLSAGPITDLDKWGERLGWRAPNFKVGSEAA